MSDLELIKEIEQRIGKPLKTSEPNSLKGRGTDNGYSLNVQQQLIELNLDKCQLDDISFLEHCTQLKTLSLNDNQITNLTVLQELKSLTNLSLNRNQIADIAVLNELKNLNYIGLNSNKIIEFTALKNLKKLNTLYLSKNQISDISALKELKSLNSLDLSYNKITEIIVLKNLESLIAIDLSHNSIIKFYALKDMKSIRRLDLSFNKISELPLWVLNFNVKIKWKRRFLREKGLFFENNPLNLPPPEIIQQGNATIKAYFDSLQPKHYEYTEPLYINIQMGNDFEINKKLNELKVLFVGDGGSGKTSLSKVLRSETFNPQESQTHGINIDDLQHQDLTLHFWDFGGQKTMHASHQFFLSKRSLYILVLDGRKDEDAEYWLKYIESFGGNSPVLIVLNKIDEHPSFDVNRKNLLDKHRDTIMGFYKLSCDTKEGLAEFKQAFIKAFDTIEMLQTVWGESWFNVKQSLEAWKQDYITVEEYRKLCITQQINELEIQNILAQYLNDLGVVVYFDDFGLNETQVLNPRWLTEAVYKIINAKQLATTQGVLCLQDLTDILKPVTDEDYQYPPEKHRHITELMKKFELCYELDKLHILIPDLLDIQEPDFSFADKQPLRFRLEYDFLPKSIMPRFIVKRHSDIKDNLRWRTGVVLYDKNTDATAIIRADDRERLIDIQVGGKQKRDYFAVIRGTLNDIHASFQKLTITELVPLPDNPTICLEYQELIGYELDGEDNYRVGKLRKVYSVSALLNGIEKKEQRQQDNIFVNGDYVQEKRVAEINQHSNGNTKLTPELEELYRVLKEIDNGKKSFKPNDEGIEELKKFQSIACCLKEAEFRSYISKVSYQVSKGRESHGMTTTAIVTEGLTFKGVQALNNPEKLIIDNQPQASIDMSTQNVNISGSTVHGSVLAAKTITNALNTVQTSQANDDIKQLLTALLKQIEELNSKVPAEAIKPIIRNAEDLVREVDSDEPRKDNSLLSLNGIKDAAIKLGDIAKPIIEIAEKISPFLLSFL